MDSRAHVCRERICRRLKLVQLVCYNWYTQDKHQNEVFLNQHNLNVYDYIVHEKILVL